MVECAVDRHAVELVADLGEVAAPYEHRLVPAALTARDERSGQRRDRRICALEIAAAAERIEDLLIDSTDAVDVLNGSGADERQLRVDDDVVEVLHLGLDDEADRDDVVGD